MKTLELSRDEEFALFGAIEARIRQLEIYAESGKDETMIQAAEVDIKTLKTIQEKMGF